MKYAADAVLRYCPSLDRFVKVRTYTEAESAEVLASARFTSRREYIRFLLVMCIADYESEVMPFLQGRELEGSSAQASLELALYALCVDENPQLEIRRVSVPMDSAEDAEEAEAAPEREPEEDKSVYLDLADRLKARVVGQGEAVSKVAAVMRRAAAGLRDPRRPMGSFFFLGPTGVGKTELAKVLSELAFGGEERLVRIDCSEYSQPHEYAKLIGAPPGYVGHQEGGQLTDAVREKQRCVVLFDEFEKANTKVHQLLLQILDEGVITDSKGRKVEFSETVVILTGNVGAREVADLDRRMGFGERNKSREVEAESMKALRLSFPPEFLNRLDEVVIFRPLDGEDSMKICEIMLKQVGQYLSPRHITVRFDPAVRRMLVEEGTDARYGARPLRRTIQRRVLDPMSEEVLVERIRPHDKVRVRLGRKGVIFSVRHAD